MKMIGSRNFWKLSGGIAGLLIVLAILIAVNIIAGNVRWRADMTDEGLYTLSDGSRKILGNLDRKVTLKLFVSQGPEIPMYLKNYADQVEDLLHEYRIASARKVIVEKYDPQPDSDAEEWAQRYGIGGQQLGMMGPTVYFGLVAVAGDTEGLLPSLDPRTQQLLEYNITRLIYRVANPRKPAIGIMSALPVLGESSPYPMPGQPPRQSEPWITMRELQADYDVRKIEVDTQSISPAIDALIVIHPKDIGDKTLYAIDQFVLGGGRVLVFVDPLCIADMESSPAASPYQRPQASSDLARLFGAWGVDYSPASVVADIKAATRVRAANNRVEESLVWLSLGPASISRDDILTTRLESMLLPFTGAFSDSTDDAVTFTPLLTSSDMAGRVNTMTAQFGGDALRREFKKEAVDMFMAVRLAGTFKTAFPDGPPSDEADDADADEANEADEADEAGDVDTGLKEGESAIVLVADVDMLWDRFCVQEMNFFGMTGHQPINDNLNFTANAIEQVAGSSDLIGIRSRGTFNRPFDRVLALEQQARDEWQARENDLVGKLRDTQQQLREMEEQKDSSQKYILSPKQRDAIKRFRAEELNIKQELKEVRKNLRRDIEHLGIRVKVINIALMPLLVALAGVGYGLYRKHK